MQEATWGRSRQLNPVVMVTERKGAKCKSHSGRVDCAVFVKIEVMA